MDYFVVHPPLFLSQYPPIMLIESHRAEWLRSAVSAEIIDRNVWTIEDPRELDKLLNRNTDKKWKHSDLVPGWAVAGVDPKTGERVYTGAQFKPDKPRPAMDSQGHPRLDENGDQRFVKYESPHITVNDFG